MGRGKRRAVRRLERNDRCVCGSGRKFKACHGSGGDPMVKSVAAGILEWFTTEQAETCLMVMEEWNVRRGGEIDEQQESLAIDWLMHDRPFESGQPPAAVYAAQANLSASERERAQWLAQAHLRLYRVRDYVPGQWLEIEDLDSGECHLVTSSLVSREVARWDVLAARLLPAPVPELWGRVRLWTAEEEEQLLAHREATRAASAALDEAEAAAFVARALLEFQPEAVERIPYAVEGTPLREATAHWQVDNPEEVLRRLDDPPLIFLIGPTDDGRGLLFEVTCSQEEITALREEVGALPDNAVTFESSHSAFPDRQGFGSFILAGDKLYFEGLSELRLNFALGLVAEKLGGRARLLSQELGEEMPPLQTTGAGPRPSLHEIPSPEQAEAMEEFSDAYGWRWLETSIPLLGGKTPRQAVLDPELRPAVERLLRQLENRAERQRHADGTALDFSALARRELQMEEALARPQGS